MKQKGGQTFQGLTFRELFFFRKDEGISGARAVQAE